MEPFTAEQLVEMEMEQRELVAVLQLNLEQVQEWRIERAGVKIGTLRYNTYGHSWHAILSSGQTAGDDLISCINAIEGAGR